MDKAMCSFNAITGLLFLVKKLCGLCGKLSTIKGAFFLPQGSQRLTQGSQGCMDKALCSF
jgi:hypothetical protein